MAENTSGPSVAKQLGILLIVLLLVGVGFTYVKWQQAEKRLLSVQQNQTGTGSQNQETAKRIVEQVRKLYALLPGMEPTVATIVDVDALRKRNAFYEKAKNGDYLIVTNDRAILFDAKANVIIDVVPVQIQQPQTSSSAASAAAKPASSAPKPASSAARSSAH